MFFFNFIVLKLFLWTGRMQFRQSLQKYLAIRPGYFHSLSEKDTNFLFVRNIKFFSTCFSAHVECNFDNTWKTVGNRPKKFVQLPKVIEEVQLFWKVFPKIVLMDRWKECTLANQWEISNRRSKNLRSLPKNEEGTIVWSEDFLPRNVPTVTLNALLLTRRNQFPGRPNLLRSTSDKD